ncbi:MAG: hypothetical protein JXB05_26305 [Myxococcaceae bacterium]|nr:hypothetical protein [Myxococcaceae bacterium]
MRWIQVVGALSVMALSGCPSEFGKDGRVNKAVRQDSQEHLLFITGCEQRRYEEVCGPGKWDSEECLRCRRGGVQ